MQTLIAITILAVTLGGIAEAARRKVTHES